MLDQFSREILDFERNWWLLPGPKDELIADRLGCSAADYYNHLLSLLDQAPARDYDPLTIHRLRRIRGSTNRASGA
jgi:Protein of unknown function (DUF3263)